MASRAEMSENLPDTLPADFGDWDTPAPPEVEPAPVPEPAAAPPPTHEFMPAEARSQQLPLPRDGAAYSARLSAHPRAFAAAANIPPRTPSSAASAYPVAGAYLRRIRSLNTTTDRPTPAPAKAEPNAFTRAAEFKQQEAVEPAPSPAEPDDSHFRALFHDHAPLEVEEPEHSAGAKWKIIFAVATGSLLLVAFQFFHSGAASRMGHMVGQQAVAVKMDTALQSAPSAAAPAAQRPNASGIVNQKPSAAVAQADPLASHGQAPLPPDQRQASMMRDQLMAPTRIPQNIRGNAPVDAPPGSVGGIEALNGGSVGNVFSGQARPDVKAALRQPLAVSAGIAAGMLIYQTAPVYPSIAKAARVSGTVVIQATITKAGTVANARVTSGPAMLQRAALDSVKTWRFRPYKLNNEPTEVETTVNVNFTLGR